MRKSSYTIKLLLELSTERIKITTEWKSFEMGAKINSANFPPAETKPKELCEEFAECLNIFQTILNRVRFVSNGSCLINPIKSVYPL